MKIEWTFRDGIDEDTQDSFLEEFDRIIEKIEVTNDN